LIGLVTTVRGWFGETAGGDGVAHQGGEISQKRALENITMTDDKMTLRELVEKGSNMTLLRVSSAKTKLTQGQDESDPPG
jgi:hypothetical protein